MKKMKFGLLLLLISIGSLTFAYKPVFVVTGDNNTFEKAETLEDLSIPKLVYGRLETDSEVDFYKFVVASKTNLNIKLLVPYKSENSEFLPSLVILGKDINPSSAKVPFAFPSDQKPLVLHDSYQSARTVFYESSLWEYFYAGPEISLDFSPEFEYTIAIYTPAKKTGDYAVGIGTTQPLDLQSYIKSLQGIIRVKLKSSDWQQGLAYILIFLAVLFIFSSLILNLFRAAEKKKGFLTILGNLLLGVSAIIVAYSLLIRPQQIINPPKITSPTPVPTPIQISANTLPVLKLTNFKTGQIFESNSINLNFEVENYSLESEQTGITIILDSQSPTLIYSNEYSLRDLVPGFHKMDIFLIDKNQKALKNSGSYLSTYFYSGNKETENKLDLTKPILIINTGSQIRKIKSEILAQKTFWIDFFTINAFINESAYKIQYTIDDKEPKYQPSQAEEIKIQESLNPGKHTIKLAIVDNNNIAVGGEYSAQNIDLEIESEITVTTTPNLTPESTTPEVTASPTTEPSKTPTPN